MSLAKPRASSTSSTGPGVPGTIGTHDCYRVFDPGHAAFADGGKQDRFLVLQVHLHLAGHLAKQGRQIFGHTFIAEVHILNPLGHCDQLRQLFAVASVVACLDMPGQGGGIGPGWIFGHEGSPVM